MPDRTKKNDLKRRLYDSGISNIPMPSVKRPIEENISSRPFSARMNSSKIQSLSPLKKKIQDMNNKFLNNLNDSYQEAARLEKGGYSEAFYQSQQPQIPNFAAEPRRGMAGQTSGGFGGSVRVVPGSDHFAANRVLLNKAQRTRQEVPPLDPDTKNRLNQSLNAS